VIICQILSGNHEIWQEDLQPIIENLKVNKEEGI
jgi:hypothetical protein